MPRHAPLGQRIPTRVALERDLRIDRDRVLATIVVAASGGPLRTLITGREPHPTGRIVCLKAQGRAVPWESIRAERPLLYMCEVATPVVSLLAQPHQLEMRVAGRPEPLVHAPDLQIEADMDFVDALRSGLPFAQAVAEWTPSTGRLFRGAVVVLEAKTDDDPRNDDQEYQDKIRLAREVYQRIGWSYFVVRETRDIVIEPVSASVREIALDRDTRVTNADAAKAADLIAARGGLASYGALAERLGKGPVGRAKASALHARRVVAIELRAPLSADSPVRLVADGRALA